MLSNISNEWIYLWPPYNYLAYHDDYDLDQEGWNFRTFGYGYGKDDCDTSSDACRYLFAPDKVMDLRLSGLPKCGVNGARPY